MIGELEMGQVTQKGEIPTKPHYAILVYVSFSYIQEAYDYGKPNTNETMKMVKYYAYETRAEWEEEISRLEKRGDVKYDAFTVSKPATVEKKIVVNIN